MAFPALTLDSKSLLRFFLGSEGVLVGIQNMKYKDRKVIIPITTRSIRKLIIIKLYIKYLNLKEENEAKSFISQTSKERNGKQTWKE
jgi:hypothetical protein